MAAMYRVSSRSFPNRQTVLKDTSASIVPKEGYESDIMKNPYIAYNCLRIVNENIAVATNGSQTDPIAEKLASGMNIRDSLVTVLHALDYEHDDYNTPRIAAVVCNNSREGYLGIVRKDAVLVRAFLMEPSTAYYVCTYEHNTPTPHYADAEFSAETAADACTYVLGKGAFAQLERPITAACAVSRAGGGFELAAADAPVA
jgi:IMP cyclohydrolase